MNYILIPDKIYATTQKSTKIKLAAPYVKLLLHAYYCISKSRAAVHLRQRARLHGQGL